MKVVEALRVLCTVHGWCDIYEGVMYFTQIPLSLLFGCQFKT